VARGPDEAAEDMDALGIQFAADEEGEADEKADPLFEVWPENWPALELFLDCSTQWRCVAMPEGTAGMVSAIWSRIVRTGLDYTAVRSALMMRRVPVKWQGELLDDLQAMEYAALDEMRIRREDASA